MTAPERTSIESLLAHRGWVRDLALRIAGDPSLADDLEQDVWMAALRHPPRPEGERGSLRAWLGTVLRNRFRERHRWTTRRSAREARAAQSESVAGAADIASRADAHRHVVSTVLALDEPYRATVLFLFFEGLTPTETAARLDVPVETVRTRARRALDLLRARLDRDHGGDRRAWVVAVLGADVWRRLAEGGSTAAAKGTTAAAIAAGGMMANATKAGMLAGGLVLGIAMTLGAQAVAGKTETSPRSEVAGRAATPAVLTHQPEQADAGPSSAEAAAPERDAPGASARVSDTGNDSVLTLPSGDPLPPATAATISGRVTDPEGGPVAGVQLRFYLRPQLYTTRRTGIPPVQSDAEAAEAAIRNVRFDRATTHDVVTDAAGAFVVSGLLDADYSFHGWGHGCQLRPSRQRTWVARPGDVLDLIAEPRGEIEIHVVNLDGQQVERAQIRWRPAGQRGGGGIVPWMSRQPFIEVGVGEIEFVAKGDGDDPLESAPIVRTIGQGTHAEVLELTLGDVPRIRGRVRVPEDQPWGYLHVRLLEGRHDGPIGFQTVRNARRSNSARPPDYTFGFDDIEPGEYTVLVSHGGIEAAARGFVHVGSGTAECSVDLPRVTESEAVVVRVVDESGSVLDDVDFRASVTAGAGSASGGVHSILRADGTYLVRVVEFNRRGFMERSSSKDFKWTLTAVSKTAGSVQIPFELGGSDVFEARITRPASVEVKVLGYASRQHGDRVLVSLDRVDGRPWDNETRRSSMSDGYPVDVSGRFASSQVPTGTYRLAGWVRCGQLACIRFESRVIRIDGGPNRFELTLPTLSNLLVRDASGEKDRQYRLRCNEWPELRPASLTSSTKGSGSAGWRDLPPGRYVLSTKEDGEWRHMPIRLPEQRDVTFRAAVVRTLRILEVEPGGDLAAAGFLAGDRVEGVDGERFRSMDEATKALFLHASSDSVRYSVRRGERLLEIVANGALLVGNRESGGRWTFVAE